MESAWPSSSMRHLLAVGAVSAEASAASSSDDAMAAVIGPSLCMVSPSGNALGSSVGQCPRRDNIRHSARRVGG
jgi:hypothetical protein